MEKIIPISDLQTQAKKYVDQVNKTDQPVIITQRGRAAAVLVKFESYEGHVLTQEEASYPDSHERFTRAERELKKSKGITLEDYMKKRARRSVKRKAG